MTVTVVVVLLSVSGHYNRFGHRHFICFGDFLGLLAEVFAFVRIFVIVMVVIISPVRVRIIVRGVRVGVGVVTLLTAVRVVLAAVRVVLAAV